VRRLDLRVPDRDRLRISKMIELVEREAREHAPVAICGSSLGGWVAAHVATRVDVLGAVLMAPAYGLAERWPKALGRERMERWRDGEPLVTDDHAGGPPLRVDYGFYEDGKTLEPWPLPRCPLLVFHGRSDDTVPIAGSRELVQRACDARLVELDDGHALVDSLPLILPEAHAFLDRLWETHHELERDPE
jgi:pimeloyl-ACP methyl ester carboxylesterase